MKLLIAGGGTGGHLFPALAIATAVRAQDPGGSVLFVGTRHGIEARVIPATEFPIRFITARGIRKTGIFNTLHAAVEIPLGIFQSFRIIHKFRPDCVLGVGGYASGPTLAAAVMLRVPTAIQEQNSVMGTTNKILSRFVDRIFTSWEDTDPPTPPEKTIAAGNPVRTGILEGSRPEAADKTFNILIFGGSRGARSINQAIAGNLSSLAPLAHGIKVIHQTGEGAVQEIKAAYEAAGINAEVSEFIQDMGPAYHWADLVVCRSGASSLAEITALGKPAIVVPYPYAIGNHQERNARVLEKGGAVRVVLDDLLKNGALVNEIGMVLERPELLSQMAENSRRFGRPDAAGNIAEEILEAARRGK